MKVLFITWKTYPINSATINCVMAVIRELRRHDIHADVFNLTGNFELPAVTSFDGVQFHNVFDTRFADFGQLLRKRKRSVLPAIRERVVSRLSCRYRDRAYHKHTVRPAIRKLEKIAGEYDVLIAACSHVMNGVICSEYCKKTGKPFILYQLDTIQEVEMQLYAQAQAIVTTPILAAEKARDDAYAPYLSKVFPAEFPIVRDLTAEKDPVCDGEAVECFYSGRFYGNVRDCTFPLEVLRRVDPGALRLVFAGDGQEKEIAAFQKEYFGDRLQHLGMISLDESFAKMKEADVLINIGNCVTSLLPSKLFDYISTGKPILNFCKLADCPTIPYLNKYRLGLNVIEGEKALDQQADDVLQFIETTRNARIPFDEILRAFPENTADYVGQLFADLLKERVASQV